MEINENVVYSQKALYDIKLVERAVGGDQSAFAELLSRYRDSIYFLLLKMVGSKIEAEDLTIETFGKAFKSLEQYSTNFAFSTWLLKIASNNAIDFLRRRRAMIVSIDGDEKEDSHPINIVDNGLSPAEEMIKSQMVDAVRAVVKELKPRYRQLVEMRYFQELSYEEISEQLSIPLGTVKAQLFRSRELLYNMLKNTETAQDRQ